MRMSFADLCDTYTKAPLLAHLDPARPYRLGTDASRFAIAGMISQQLDHFRKSAEDAGSCWKLLQQGQWHPVAIESHSMYPRE